MEDYTGTTPSFITSSLSHTRGHLIDSDSESDQPSQDYCNPGFFDDSSSACSGKHQSSENFHLRLFYLADLRRTCCGAVEARNPHSQWMISVTKI